MNYLRYFLYTALALVSYVMLLAWNADYPPSANNVVPSQVPTLTSVPEPAVEPTLAPVSTSSDVPAEVPVITSNPSPLAVPSDQPTAFLPATTPGRMVQITTDTLSLGIDLSGGDVVHLALPLHPKTLDAPEQPFVLLENGESLSYVAQSGLIGRNGIDNSNRAVYRSRLTDYTLAENADTLTVDLLTVDTSGVEVTKRFTLLRGSYVISVEYIVRNPTTQPWQANLFAQIKRGDYPDPSDAGGFGQSFLGFAATSVEDPYIKLEFEDIDSGVAPIEMTGGWIAFSQHYFLTAWIPEQSKSVTYSLRKNNINQYIGGFVEPAFTVEPGATASQTIQLYAGPTDQNALAELAPNLNLTIDYGVLWFLAVPIYWLLTHIEPLVGNFGVAIILLTLVVKAAFYKLTETQYKSMAGMRRVMPKMQQLKDSYGDDKVKLQKATMDLYKKEKINPFGGCLPMLVQMPVFIALYWTLMRSVELRQAPFILWINDLSVLDPYFVLPLLMGASMYAQSLLSPAPSDPMQAKIMRLMPALMTVFFLFFPAGLVLYWLVNSVLGIAQQWYITRKLDAAYEAKNSS